jgi:hypothetical protein
MAVFEKAYNYSYDYVYGGGGDAVALWLRTYATNRKVAGSEPVEVIL